MFWPQAGVCHLSTPSVSRRLEQPTPRQWTSNPSLPVYLALQPAGCAASDVATGAGGLLPRLFTLTSGNDSHKGGGYFLSHLPRRCRRLPVRMCGALCCPDFPLRDLITQRQTSFLQCKIND